VKNGLGTRLTATLKTAGRSFDRGSSCDYKVYGSDPPY